MKCFSVDLYDYYGVKKPDGGKGILTCYVKENSEEIDPERRAPAILIFPGGAYVFCSFRENEPVALKYMAFGFNAFVLDYSVAPVRYPYALAETYMAMEYLRQNADELLIDENKITALGFSAGGHLCGTLGSYFDSEDAEAVFKGKFSPRPNAVVLCYPVITYGEKSHNFSFDSLCGENEELKRKLQVNKLVNGNSAPAFIWATYNDNGVPVRNSLEVALAYEKAGVPFSLHVFGNGVHGLSVADITCYGDHGLIDTASLSTGEWVRLSVEWLAELGIKIDDRK
ncbi:MAG: alpha/beta hydrolase [Clostridia bacterium]|nr:alpha/beta hydrolase [Clostridia bacterium]